MKHKILYLFILFTTAQPVLSQNVGIGTINPDVSSVLEILSSEKGMLIPRMTETDRINIPGPAEGLTVYQTDNNEGFYYYDGTYWQYIGNRNNDAWTKNTANSSTNTSFSADNIGAGTSNPSAKADIRGYFGAENQFTVIPLWKGTTYTVNNNTAADIPNCESGILPQVFEINGNIQVKLIIRAVSRSGVNNFQLRAHNGISEVYPIVNTDSWTWAYTGGGETVTSPWKDWNAGTSPFEIHLNAWAQNPGDYVEINAVYLVVRPKQP